MASEKRSVIYTANVENQTDDDLLPKCFEIGSDVEMKEIPNTGEEYLLKVVKERANVAAVTVCDKDITKFTKNQSRFYKEPPRTKPAPDKLKPTIEWQKIQIKNFTDVRTYMSNIMAELSKRNLWSVKVKTIVIPDQSLVGWKVFFIDNDSTVTCMLGLTPQLLDMGLEMLTNIIREVAPGDTIDHKTGRWIYAFLARLTHPPLSETISLLRNLARACAEIRSHINQEEEDASLRAAPLNLFICIVARYFGQLDLAD
ncbi:gem-associated protein 2-like isoform X1 [Cydia pomonella]|uniref:gem-associated protein 2-like isoform X1 n=2 Tax=Cydia pomonella TaxID=82600 RepID=UPI002ADE7318|nr:gem-associated protein 2-like isoform X1 [Cydia pomonella]